MMLLDLYCKKMEHCNDHGEDGGAWLRTRGAHCNSKRSMARDACESEDATPCDSIQLVQLLFYNREVWSELRTTQELVVYLQNRKEPILERGPLEEIMVSWGFIMKDTWHKTHIKVYGRATPRSPARKDSACIRVLTTASRPKRGGIRTVWELENSDSD